MIQIVEPIDRISTNTELKRLIEDVSFGLDICYDIRYLERTSCAYDGRLYFAFQKKGEDFILYPFILRSISNDLFDIITPFEYGGPVAHCNAEFIITFKQFFDRFCEQNNIISEFIRFHPLLTNYRLWSWISSESSCENIIIDLEQSEEAIFSSYHKNNRRDIRLAQRQGVVISNETVSTERIASFTNIYYKIMDQRKAGSFYYFSDQYFNGLFSLPVDNVQLYFARLNDKRVGTAIILQKGGIVHYHLSGTLREATKACPNNLLLHTAIIDAQRHGNKYFHLGGASSMDSGLYRFKSKFSNLTTPYYIGKRIINFNIYNELMQKWSHANKQEPTNYFPAYRAPGVKSN